MYSVLWMHTHLHRLAIVDANILIFPHFSNDGGMLWQLISVKGENVEFLQLQKCVRQRDKPIVGEVQRSKITKFSDRIGQNRQLISLKIQK